LGKSVFNDLVYSINKPKISLLDLGCGSAKISMRLCAQAYANTKNAFDVLLVDTIPSRFSIARSFYNNYQAFDAIRYKRSELFNWIANMQNDSKEYDITLMLRFLDTLSQYQAELISHEKIISAIKKCGSATLQIPTSQLILDSPSDIIHSLHRIKMQNGSAYFQPSLRDFFKAVFLCCNMIANVESNNDVVLPVRSFFEERLVMQDGISIFEKIMNKSQYLIIEDSEVSLKLLCDHARKRKLTHLAFSNTLPARGLSGSHCTLISHNRRYS
jgi:SAM-dependent methyltransferase